jgi:hypothetical protein
MGLIPDTINGKIEFYRSKTTPWTTNATAIGTTTTAVTALGTKVTAAQAKLDAQIALRAELKAATADLHLAIRDLAAAGGDIIKQIRAKAAADGDGVYVLAQIPAPAAPTPVPPPGTPTDFKVAVRADGALVLDWKCPNPPGASGTVYQVSRQLGADAPMTLLGASGGRRYIDTTLPAGGVAAATAGGAGGVTYQIVALRSTVAGSPAQFTVKFGCAPGGAATASVVAGPKLAA